MGLICLIHDRNFVLGIKCSCNMNVSWTTTNGEYNLASGKALSYSNSFFVMVADVQSSLPEIEAISMACPPDSSRRNRCAVNMDNAHLYNSCVVLLISLGFDGNFATTPPPPLLLVPSNDDDDDNDVVLRKICNDAVSGVKMFNRASFTSTIGST